MPIDLMFPLPDQRPTQYARHLRDDHLQTSYQQVRKHMQVQQRRQKEVFNRKAGGAGYKVGDLEWLCGHSRKLHASTLAGTICGEKEINDVVYRIQSLAPPLQRIVVHFNRLKTHHERVAEETSSHTATTCTSRSTLEDEVMDSTSEGADYMLDTQPPTNVSGSTVSERQPTATRGRHT